MTEYLKKVSLEKTNIDADENYYSPYTRLVYYLAELVGKDSVAEACFTADLSKIRKNLDRIGGFGTFDRFMNANFKNRYRFLKQLCNQRGLDIEKFEENLQKWGKIRFSYEH